jgi:tetratricopeptide (TPR) repeat protein
MSDYINYIDFNAIKLADLAYEIGDYKCAVDYYSKALNRLRNYQGDRMQPIMMASGIVEKINKINTKIGTGKAILKFDVWKLTKSSFVKGNQCLKYLYLDKHKKQEKTPISKEKQELFNQGHKFEELVRNNEFPDGINIKDKVGNFAYFNSYTKHLINSASRQTIYEASIIEEEVLVMCDILVKNEDGNIHIYEIKLNTELNDAIIADLAVQYTICKKRFTSNLKSFNIVLKTEDNNWKIENLTDSLEKQVDIVISKINDFKMILQKDEPSLLMGEHCNKPYECEFIEYCKNKC